MHLPNLDYPQALTRQRAQRETRTSPLEPLSPHTTHNTSINALEFAKLNLTYGLLHGSDSVKLGTALKREQVMHTGLQQSAIRYNAQEECPSIDYYSYRCTVH